METKIGEVKGFTIAYDSRNRVFNLLNADGEIVGSGKTQDEVEKQADKLAKQGFTFPMPALLKGTGSSLHLGKVTSVNLNDKSCRFVYQDKTGYKSHTKVRISYNSPYELTVHNNGIYQNVKTLEEQIAQLYSEIAELTNHLEKPINLEYFGLQKSY